MNRFRYLLAIIKALFISISYVHCEQYYNSYYNYDLDAFVECFGSPDTEPFCRKLSDHSSQPQFYNESNSNPIDCPISTDIHEEEHLLEPGRNLRGTSRPVLIDENTTKDKPKIFKNLVLLIRFPEHQDRFLFPAKAFELLFNGRKIQGPEVPTHTIGESTNGTTFDDSWTENDLKKIIPTGSVQEFYKQQTYGKLLLDTVVVGWVNVSISEQEASGGCSALCSRARLRDAITEALQIVDAENLIDFENFDLDDDSWVDVFTVITSSAGAESSSAYDDLGVPRQERIWSHKHVLRREFVSEKSRKRVQRYSVSPGFYSENPNREMISRIGVLSHEVAHFLGLPDFYDTSYRSAGLHVYDTMSNSWGVAGLQLRPNNFSPRNKHQLGALRLKIPIEGRNLIRPSNGDSDHEVYALSGEMFGYAAEETIYIDYWKRSGYSANHPGGILIYHADERVLTGNKKPYYPEIQTIPHNGEHYQVRLIQANGEFKLEKQPWPRRYDETIFWNDPGLELSDYGPNNLMSWKQLEKPTLHDCKTTGNFLYGFQKVPGATDLYEFYYERRTQENCYSQTKPRRTFDHAY